MPTLDPGVVVAVASFILNCIVAIVGLTWGVAKITAEINARIDTHRREINEQLEINRHEFGETAAALRQKIHDDGMEIRERLTKHELFSRDTYVRRESFYKVVDDLSSNLKAMSMRIETQIVKLGDKIDDIIKGR